jgi:hypothetical protein
LQTSALPLGYAAVKKRSGQLANGGRQVDQLYRQRPTANCPLIRTGAGDEGRTRDFDLGKVALYH